MDGIVGPRAALRALDVIMELASRNSEMAIGEMAQSLMLPRASLHRLLRMLDGAGFLHNRNGSYVLGPKSYQLARMIVNSGSDADFPACARPVTEYLFSETNETVILGDFPNPGARSSMPMFW